MLAHAAGEFCRLRLCGKYIALHLAERDWAARQASIGVKNRVIGILPALIDKTRPGLRPIFDKTVIVCVAKTIAPMQSCLDIWPNRGNRR
jgi:hypothetical protein